MTREDREDARAGAAPHSSGGLRTHLGLLALVFAAAVVATLLVTWVLVTMFGRKQ